MVSGGTCLCKGASSVELSVEKHVPTALMGTGRFPESVAGLSLPAVTLKL